MVNRFSLFVVASGALLATAAADYFPIQTGNAWTFLYVSTSAPVVPNPPTLRDSGTVKWEIVSNRIRPLTEGIYPGILLFDVKQTRSLVRRTLTQTGSSGYDSIFTPSRKTIDTISLWDDPLLNKICFSGDTCPFAAHDPTVAMPTGLSSKDTTVPWVGSLLPIAGKKMIVSEYSCLHKLYSYSFTLGPTVGPVEAYITWCPTMSGSSYKETWKLIGREYPAVVLNGNAETASLKTFAYSQSAGRINCSLDLDYSSPIQIELTDPAGRLIKTLFKGNLNAGVYRYSWDIPTNIRGIALFRVRTGAHERCVKVLAGVKGYLDK